MREPERLNDASTVVGSFVLEPGLEPTAPHPYPTQPPQARDSVPYDLLPFLSAEVELQIKM